MLHVPTCSVPPLGTKTSQVIGISLMVTNGSHMPASGGGLGGGAGGGKAIGQLAVLPAYTSPSAVVDNETE
jgi:hypothetical protein